MLFLALTSISQNDLLRPSMPEHTVDRRPNAVREPVPALLKGVGLLLRRVHAEAGNVPTRDGGYRKGVTLIERYSSNAAR